MFGRGVWDGGLVGETIEQSFLVGAVGWVFGYVAAIVLSRLAVEHVAVLAGQTAEPAEQGPNSQDRISAPETNN